MNECYATWLRYGIRGVLVCNLKKCIALIFFCPANAFFFSVQPSSLYQVRLDGRRVLQP
jgi:hypothetical protein